MNIGFMRIKTSFYGRSGQLHRSKEKATNEAVQFRVSGFIGESVNSLVNVLTVIVATSYKLKADSFW